MILDGIMAVLRTGAACSPVANRFLRQRLAEVQSKIRAQRMRHDGLHGYEFQLMGDKALLHHVLRTRADYTPAVVDIALAMAFRQQAEQRRTTTSE